MKIYTKTGDLGKTTSWGGEKVDKYSLEIEVIGLADEAISWLGIVHSSLMTDLSKEVEVANSIVDMQNNLFNICALASANKKRSQEMDKERITSVEKIEKLIDKYDELLPTLENFILPGGAKINAEFHYGRAKIRTLERLMAKMANTNEPIRSAIAYVNRCSDLLFVYARYVSFKLNIAEIKVAYAKSPDDN